jgi:hypothetical protein
LVHVDRPAPFEWLGKWLVFVGGFRAVVAIVAGAAVATAGLGGAALRS